MLAWPFSTNQGVWRSSREAAVLPLQEVEDAMDRVQLSRALRRRIRHYYSTAWAPTEGEPRVLAAQLHLALLDCVLGY
jgi:hypothetical protein